jgi:UPF0176 protein
MFEHLAAYAFVAIEDPPALAVRLRARCEALSLLGTVLVAEEGLNLFLAGAPTAVGAFLGELRDDSRFAAIATKIGECETQPFARLKVKVKPEIISFRREHASPLLGRAPAVSPQTLRRWIAQGADDAGRALVLLDARNREEVAYGTFDDALTLPIDNFTELPEALAPHRDAFAETTVVSFCTGGIRCEKAALWMRAQGMDNVWQLDGGILGYFEAVGGEGYRGDCFVFDARIALDPQLRPIAAALGPDAAGPDAAGPDAAAADAVGPVAMSDDSTGAERFREIVPHRMSEAAS